MRYTRLACLMAALAALIVLPSSCKDSTAPTTGTVRIRVVTTGSDIDPDGYVVRVDGGNPRLVNVLDTIAIAGLDEVEHSITLSEMTSNCSVADNPKFATVTAGATMEITFSVFCAARLGNITITTISTGQSISPQPYGMRLDGFQSGTIATSGIIELTGVHEGEHDLTLTSVPANCTVLGLNPRPVVVVYGENTPVAFAISCSRRNGELRVVIATSGIDIDGDGYVIRVDGISPTTAATTSSTSFSGIAEGAHTITLGGVQPNCTVAQPYPRNVTVLYAQTVVETILVTCVRRVGVLRVTVRTTGADFDPNGYRLIVDAFPTRAVGVNSIQLYPDLPTASTHGLYVYDISRNCEIQGPWSMNDIVVPENDTLDIVLEIVCVPGGAMHVTVTTAGVEQDASGYKVHMVGLGLDTLPAVTINGSVDAAALLPGSYSVTLSDVAGNCDVGGISPRVVTVSGGTTANVAFDVQCAVSGTIAYVFGEADGREIYTVKTSGVGETRLTNSPGADLEPDWSPNGAKIAFSSHRAGSPEIYVMNADGSGVVRLTTNTTPDEQPVWSPDGARIAFVSWRDGNSEIYIMDADGQNVVRRSTNAAFDAEPSWSPDGTRIAFRSNRTGNAEIFVMNADGSNVVRVTFNETEDTDPTWSPDGNSIAFVRRVCIESGCGAQRIFTISPDGTNLRQITSGDYDLKPSWSGDNQKIVYSRYQCDIIYDYYYYYNCYNLLSIVTVASGAVSDVTTRMFENDPAWRR